MLVSVLDAAAVFGMPQGRDITFYRDRFADLDREFGMRTPVLPGWKGRPGFPEGAIDALLAAVERRNAANSKAKAEARAKGVPPARFASAGQREMARAGRRYPEDGKARRVQQLRAAGATEAQIAQYVARLDEAQAGVW